MTVEGAGGLALTSAGVGGVNGDCSGVIEAFALGVVVVVVADCRTGGCGTPAVVLLRVPGRTTLSGVGGDVTAYDLCGHRQCAVVVVVRWRPE